MISTKRAYRGMVVAPHHLAAQAGLRVLTDGGNAIEAMVAAAATVAVVYPHMNGLGGDCFWLIRTPGGEMIGIDACGAAAGLASVDHYLEQGHGAIPSRGPLAACTVAGAVSGWAEALAVAGAHGARLPLGRLLEDALWHARNGIATSASQVENTLAKLGELGGVPGFAETYAPEGIGAVRVGGRLRQARLADTLGRLAEAGLDDFYRGDLAATIGRELEGAGSPLRTADLERHTARRVTPLSVRVGPGTVHNLPPPTQGLASLLILGIVDRLGLAQDDRCFDYVHRLVEATKVAFAIRDRHVTDPGRMRVDPASFLTDDAIAELAAKVDRHVAAPWGTPAAGGDTVWLGAIDRDGMAVSFIQSLYWEFGSGLVLPSTGIVWQNRGTSFGLRDDAVNRLEPGAKPFHTIQPPMAVLDDGRVVVYGTMGGDGQPQTQAMLLTRHAYLGLPPQAAVSAPRWLLGRTWGDSATSLRVERRMPEKTMAALRAAGHPVEVIDEYDSLTGHAGMLVRHPDGLLEGGADPRSDGTVAAW
ncbi:MAG: gamma-glutamyltransferase family protein [Ectothiorhodospiraceae bacterium]|nr:gamma-glutamyltransferase family protein [Chromatiales bacterium]MCP5153294.1 gamma-glutamyltransferase family protein [Ectothiorhodospiraceae bacterium]